MSYDPTAAATAADGTTADGTTTDAPPTLPTDRRTGCPFDPPAGLTALSDTPMRRLRYADGHVGRLVTGHAAARAVLADPRFSSRYELLHLPVSMAGMSGSFLRPRSATSSASTPPSTPATGACSRAGSPSAGCADSPSAPSS